MCLGQPWPGPSPGSEYEGLEGTRPVKLIKTSWLPHVINKKARTVLAGPWWPYFQAQGPASTESLTVTPMAVSATRGPDQDGKAHS